MHEGTPRIIHEGENAQPPPRDTPLVALFRMRWPNPFPGTFVYLRDIHGAAISPRVSGKFAKRDSDLVRELYAGR